MEQHIGYIQKTCKRYAWEVSDANLYQIMFYVKAFRLYNEDTEVLSDKELIDKTVGIMAMLGTERFTDLYIFVSLRYATHIDLGNTFKEFVTAFEDTLEKGLTEKITYVKYIDFFMEYIHASYVRNIIKLEEDFRNKYIPAVERMFEKEKEHFNELQRAQKRILPEVMNAFFPHIFGYDVGDLIQKSLGMLKHFETRLQEYKDYADKLEKDKKAFKINDKYNDPSKFSN